jgi:hypothetical protein
MANSLDRNRDWEAPNPSRQVPRTERYLALWSTARLV